MKTPSSLRLNFAKSHHSPCLLRPQEVGRPGHVTLPQRTFVDCAAALAGKALQRARQALNVRRTMLRLPAFVSKNRRRRISRASAQTASRGSFGTRKRAARNGWVPCPAGEERESFGCFSKCGRHWIRSSQGRKMPSQTAGRASSFSGVLGPLDPLDPGALWPGQPSDWPRDDGPPPPHSENLSCAIHARLQSSPPALVPNSISH